MKKIIEKASEILLKQDYSNESIIFATKKVRISEIIIKKIRDKNEKTISEEAWFVDGGLALGYFTNTLLISKIRVAGVEYSSNKKIRINTKINEFHALAYKEEQKINLIIEPDNELINSKNLNIKTETENGNSIIEFINQTRREAELKMLINISNDEKNKEKLFVIDGPLIRESDDLELKKSILSTKHSLLGIIKSTEDSTDKGRPASYALSRQINIKEPWYCVVEEDEIISGYAKLGKHSKFVVKFQATKKTNIEQSLLIIYKLSQDPVFPGYPYGLIEADELARISNTEKEELSSTILRESKQSKEMEEAQEMSKPHELLDNIKF